MNGRIYDPVIGRFMSADPQIQSPYDLQSYNRYSYVLNNPLLYTDPSGYSWWTKFRDNVLKPVAVIATAVIAAPYAAAYAGIMSGGSAFAMGAAAGATVGATAGLLYNGPLGAVKGAVSGGVTGGIFGGVDSYFGNEWNWKRVGANSLAGGVSSEIQGGQFRDGFKMNFITSSARLGWDYTRQVTDSMKLKSVAQPDGLDFAIYNSSGALLTDGTRLPEFAPGAQPYEQNQLMRWLSMAGEGSGGHVYDENGLIGKFTNSVSKTHDWLNSWNYNPETGRYISRGQVFDTAFDILWSFPGMPVAAAITAVSMSADISPYFTLMKSR